MRRIKSTVSSFPLNGFLYTTFTFQFSSFQWAGGLKYGMTAFSEINRHDFVNSVSFTIWLSDMSSIPLCPTNRSPKCPESKWKPFGACCNIQRIRLQLFSSPFSHHAMSLNVDMKTILPSSCSGSHFNSAIIF